MSTFDPINTEETRIPYEETAQPFLIGFITGLIVESRICLLIILNLELSYMSQYLNIYDTFLQVLGPEIDFHEA